MQETNEVVKNALSLSDLLPQWGYLSIAPFTSSQGITAVFTAIIFLVFISSLIVFIYHRSRAKARINFINIQLNKVNSSNLIESRAQIKEDMQQNTYCCALWNEFDESLVPSKNGGYPQLHNTVDAAHFFDTHTLARGMTESRLIAAMPGIITAIGVLGTFAGLTLGLGGLGEIGGGGGTQHLKEGISGMIHSASIAFTTSFWGVLASVIFNVIEKLYESNIRKSISSLQDHIDHLFPRITPEIMLMDISNSSKSSDETMLGLAEKIGDRMQEAVMQIKDDISLGMAEALQKTLAPAIDKLVSSSEETANRQSQTAEETLTTLLDGFTKKLGQTGEEQGKIMSESAAVMGELIKDAHAKQEVIDTKRQQVLDILIRKLSEQLEQFQMTGQKNAESVQSAIGTQTELTQSVKKVADDLLAFAGEIESVTRQLSDAAREMKGVNHELAETSRAMATSITSAATSNERVSESNQETSRSLQKLLDKVEGSRDSAENISAQLKSSAEAAQGTFADLKEHQEGYREALKVHVGELNEQMASTLEQYASKVGEQTHQRMEAWDKETINYTNAMQGVANAMQETISEMQEMLNKERVS